MKYGTKERLIGAGILIFLAIVFIPLFLGNKLDDLPLIQPEEIPTKPESLDISVNPFTAPPEVYEIGDDYLDEEMRLEENTIASQESAFNDKLPVTTNLQDKEEFQKSQANINDTSPNQPQASQSTKASQPEEVVQKPTNLDLNLTKKPVSKDKEFSKKGGGKMWAIQLASFSESTKAREYLGKLEKLGFEGYWRQINKLAVVFAGPYTSNPLAQAELIKITEKLKGKYFIVKYVNEFTAEKFGTLPAKNIRKSIK